MTLIDARFRASPHIEIKRLGELPPDQRESFAELESDPDFYGLCVAAPPLTANLHAVTAQTAELFRRLATPSRLDAALAGDDAIVDLVLDGILEIESGDGFVCGAGALPLLAPPPAAPAADDAVAELSREALLYAQDLETTDSAALSAALYLYNRIPLSPFWKARFAGSAAVLAQLGADRGSLRALLERGWTMSEGMRGWLSWNPITPAPRGDDDVTYKLYISPRPERMREVFGTAVRVLSDFPGTPFKIGHDAAGLLRPDKFMAYFPSRARLGEVADVLRRELAGCDAHGVPFSAAIDDGGLLSWGVDPPRNERALQWLGIESWRLWVTKRLGAALAIAKQTATPAVEPWLFAVERVRRHGVDVESWSPSAALWSAA